tara:strand:- start:9 stop:200 length:192 start_codon:yes stop_codon:yes gene_type:complete
MQNTKPNRAERRAAQSKRPANYCKNRLVKKNDGRGVALGSNIIPSNRPQIAEPSRATRFAGIT